MTDKRLSLQEALATDRLEEFIAQEEARDVPSVSKAEFDALVEQAAKSHQSEDRTSRSAYDDGSSGKRTPVGTGSRTSR